MPKVMSGVIFLCVHKHEATQCRWNKQLPQSISRAVGAASPAASGLHKSSILQSSTWVFYIIIYEVGDQHT